MTLEELLADREITWSEFCQNPYPALKYLQSIPYIFSKQKNGYFLFDRKEIQKILIGDFANPKSFTSEPSLSEKTANFFGKWLFFRDDQERLIQKRNLFKSLSKYEDENENYFSFLGSSVNNLFSDVRRTLFCEIASRFFTLTIEKQNLYYENSEAIFSAFQGGRGVKTTNLEAHIDELKLLYFEPKRFDFDEIFFDTAVLNAIIDGYEPLNDAVWNTVDILMAAPHLDVKVAYKIAITLTPSFRYVVRKLKSPYVLQDGTEISGKVYGFLSNQVLSSGPLDNQLDTMHFGLGLHTCAGRGLADSVVPAVATRIVETLKLFGVQKLSIQRSDGLGAEGITGFIVYPTRSESQVLKNEGAHQRLN